MADALRITIEELRSRMEAGEDFTISCRRRSAFQWRN